MAYIYKRGKTWTARISKRQNETVKQKDGTFAVKPVLVQKSKGGFKTKAEAEKYAVLQEAQQVQGINIMENPIFSAYFENWYLTYKKPALASSTIKRYATNSKYIAAFFKQIPIKDITRSQYQRFINEFAENHAIKSVKKIHIMIRECIGTAIDDGIISKNFTNHVKIHGNKEREMNVEYLNLKEIKRLVQLCLSTRQTRYTSSYMVLTAIYTGARIGELSALHWSDIDFKHHTISITKSWNQDRREMRPTKTKSSARTIPIDGFILNIIKELQVNNLDWVFGLPRTGFPPTSSAVNHYLRRQLELGNMKKKDFHFHSLRHSHVAYLLSQGIDIAAISKRLGHADITITLKVYAYLLEEFKDKQDNQIIQSLDKLSE